MALEKVVKVDKMEVVDKGAWKVLQVRTATVIQEDGVELSRTFSRRLIHPNDDWSSEEDEIKNICEAIHTTERKAAHTAARAETHTPGQV